ncbi:MAG: hypothetical protein ACOY7T_08250 [Pseudomonadota bacterium]
MAGTGLAERLEDAAETVRKAQEWISSHEGLSDDFNALVEASFVILRVAAKIEKSG